MLMKAIPGPWEGVGEGPANSVKNLACQKVIMKIINM